MCPCREGVAPSAALPENFERRDALHAVEEIGAQGSISRAASTAAFSAKFIVSLKYTLAKTWYLVVFVILTSMIIKKQEDFKKVFWLITLPLLFTILYTLNHHSKHDFSFLSVNTMMYPFFRNHVNYAAMISEWIPFIWLATTWYVYGSKRRYFLYGALSIFTVGLILSYTRSSWLARFAVRA